MTLPTHLFGKDSAATCSSPHVSSHWHRHIYVGVPHLTLCGKFSTMRWWARRRHATRGRTSILPILKTPKRRVRQWRLRGQLCIFCCLSNKHIYGFSCLHCCSSGEGWLDIGKLGGSSIIWQNAIAGINLRNSWRFSTALGSAETLLKCGTLHDFCQAEI